MNKTKQAKYNQRHGNKEQTENNQREVGLGGWGVKGLSSNIYKGSR